MSERPTSDPLELADRLSFWSPYIQGVADTTNEEYDLVLKNLSRVYYSAELAIRHNTGDEGLKYTLQNFTRLAEEIGVLRNYGEGEQETRIVKAFEVLKSNFESYVADRQEAERERRQQENPEGLTPSSSLSPAAPSGGGIKRPSGLKAPGERKQSVGGRSL